MPKPLLLFIGLFFCFAQAFAQLPAAALDSMVDFSEAGSDARYIHINLADNEELESAIKKIHNYRALQRLQLEGVTEPDKIAKLIFRLSLNKNLSTLECIENDFVKFPDNVAVLKFLRSLTIQGSSDIELEDAFSKLKSLPIATLSLVDNDLQKVPSNFKELKSLQRLQISGSNQLDYKALMMQLKDIYSLRYLALPFNYITDLPDNISLLQNLQVLDVSENNLFNLPNDVSALKSINQFNIHGNLLIDPLADLEKLKGNAIRYLSLDSDLSDTELENIRKIFPQVQIDFPLAKSPDTLSKPVPAVVPVGKEGNLTVKKTYKILSPAYMVFAGTMTALRYNFDTLSFDQRYLDLRYTNVSQKVPNRFDRTDAIYLRNTRFWKEVKHPRSENWFLIEGAQSNFYRGHSELRAFSGMYWVYAGPLSKKEFTKKFVLQKRITPRNRFYKRAYRMPRNKEPMYWNDIRINFDANNSLYKLTLKSDSGFIEFTAYPRFDNMDVESSARMYYRRFNTYQRGLLTRKSMFQRQQARDKTRYDIAYNRTKENSWLGLRSLMSVDERKMSKEEWFNYYDGIIATESQALDNSALVAGYIIRALSLKGYRNFVPPAQQSPGTVADRTLFDLGYRLLNLDFFDAESQGKLAVTTAYVIDPKEKSIRQYQGTAGFLPTPVWAKAFAGQILLLELRNGNWACVSAEELNKTE